MTRKASDNEGPSRRPRQGGPQGPGDKKPAQMQPGRGIFGLVSLAMLGLLLFFMFTQPRGEIITLEQFRTLYNNNQIYTESVVIRDDAVVAKQKSGPDSKDEIGRASCRERA